MTFVLFCYQFILFYTRVPVYTKYATQTCFRGHTPISFTAIIGERERERELGRLHSIISGDSMAGIAATEPNEDVGDANVSSGRGSATLSNVRRASIALLQTVPWWRHFVGIGLAIVASLVNITNGELVCS